MDVRCERCTAHYSFDDDQVTLAGLNVQCTNCGHVFKVKKKELVVTLPVKPDEILGNPPLPANAVVPPARARGAKRTFVRPAAEAVAGAPSGEAPALGALPEVVRIVPAPVGEARYVHVFGHEAEELRSRLAEIAPFLAADAVVWLSYPEGDSGLPSDLSREAVWEVARPFGLRPVAQVAVNETWSALRFERA